MNNGTMDRQSTRSAMSIRQENRDKVLQLLDSERRVLERIATGAPLEDVLMTLVKLVEEQAGGMRCGVLLADATQTRLHFIAAPSFPADLLRGMEPFLLIGPAMASCGTAAFRKEPVYARDTATDVLWREAREIALRNGVRAAWSTPILADDNHVLGTFAMTYGEPRLPDEEHIGLIDMAVQMARVAIEAKADDEILRVAFDDAFRPMVITDLDGRIARVNRAFARRLGYELGDFRGRAIADCAVDRDQAALLEKLLQAQGDTLAETRYRTRDGRMLYARECSWLRRDSSGTPLYVLTRIEQLSDGDPLVRLSARERQVFELVVAGRTSKEIAAHLGIAAGSVDTYRSRIMTKLEIHDLPALVRLAIRHGIATL
jgi:PAS domain S-box-containing protein